MRKWPSIVPDAADDYYIVVNHFGRHGTAFVETDLDRADYETTIADLMTGQHSDPLRVIMFNPATNRSEDVSHAIAQQPVRAAGADAIRWIAPEWPHPIEHRLTRVGRCRKRSDMFVRVFPQCHGSRAHGVVYDKFRVIGVSD